MRIKEATFTIMDFETTGLYPDNGDRICEIGALRVSPSGEQKRFETLVDPEREMSWGAFKVNNISPEMLAGQPRIENILPDFMDFIKGTVIVAYNAGFDLGFLKAELGSKRNLLDGIDYIDALPIARKVFPGIGSYKLSNVARNLNIPYTNAHRAMSDVFITWCVFTKELEILKGQGIDTIEEIGQKMVCKEKGYTVSEMSNKRSVFQNAIHKKEPLLITYKSVWNGKKTIRRITPLTVQGRYILAYCHLRKAQRNFRLDCIEEIKAAA